MTDLYIVHCVDTEGPLFEDIDATFQRINDVFGIDIERSIKNLERLQKKLIPLGGIENDISDLVDKQKIQTKSSWSEIDEMLNVICCDEFRSDLLDSNGNGWVYNWFCMDHVGFTGDNPRKRDFGDHRIFDHYKNNKLISSSKDEIQWHYHPLPINGNYHGSGSTYLNSDNVWQILAKKVIDRHWFPSVFRPGFHTERPDTNWFLEQWIPFDCANQSTIDDGSNQPDLSNGRYGDWSRATKEWNIYHPAIDDYQKSGNCNRWIARCLNMHARIREITLRDVIDAFKRASEGKKTLMSFTNHDFRDMGMEINKLRSYIGTSQKIYPDVDFCFSTASNAFRKVLELKESVPDIEANIINISKNVVRLDVVSKNAIFGSQPFLALKIYDGRYIWQNFDFIDKSHWSFTFDGNNIDFTDVVEIGVAANSPSGISSVSIYDVLSGEWIKKNHFIL
jgi:hypothetical protein